MEIKEHTINDMQLLRTLEGRCPECGVKHDPTYPHNNTSLYYQFKFYQDHGRWPTWADAMAHCSDEIKQIAIDVLKRNGIEVKS